MKRRAPWVLGGIVLAVVAVVLLWNWDWFIPFVDARASAALGRQVTIQHLHVQLSRRPIITADGVAIANPSGFDARDLATIGQLQVQVDIPAYLSHRQIVLPLIALDHAQVELQQRADGTADWTLPALQNKGSPAGNGPPTEIGDLRITDGHVHAVIPKLRSDFAVAIDTRDAKGTTPAQIVAKAEGTYAGQPITGAFTGGALLSLRDAKNPYPIDLELANGPTQVTIAGTVRNPLSFAGAAVTLKLTGPDMAQLFPLIGIPLPQTPNYSIAGQLDYSTKAITFRNFAGRVGSSDLGGDIAVDPTGVRPHVTADLHSHMVDLADLGGIVGSTPGRENTPGESAEQKKALAHAEASPKLIPNVPLSLPKLQAADVDLKYDAASIKGGRSIPFDSLAMTVTIKDGNVSFQPVRFGIGPGDIAGTIELANTGHALRAKANIDFQRIELHRLMQSAAPGFAGSGLIGGHAALSGTGDSLAALLGDSDGVLRLAMTQGGDLSALLVDLSGLQFGNALLSAVGVPRDASIECFITDFAIRNGDATVRTMALDTSEDDVVGQGSINLRDETLDLHLRTKSKHFSIGSLPTTIGITGPFKSPDIGPDKGELAARAGAAIGLGIVLTPLAALLPTIQFGDDANHCAGLTHPEEAAGRR